MADAAKPIANPESAAASAGYGRFLVLDGLRGIAAFAVILDHVASTTLRSWFPGRYLAVDFFFVLSGFVLAHAYGQRLREGRLSTGAFLKVRLIRLYPLYLLGLAIALIPPLVIFLKGWGGNPVAETLVVAGTGLLFLPMPPVFTWTYGLLYPLNGPAWSLFFEMIANVVYAAIARFLSPRVFAVMLPILGLATAFTVMRHTDVEGPGWLWPHFDAGLARVLFDFFAGVAIYRLREHLLAKGKGFPAIPAWLGVALLLAIFAVPATGIWRQAFDTLAAIVLMPLLVTLVSGAKVNGRLAVLCGFLGTLSYGVYVLHVPLMGLTAMALDLIHIHLPYGFVMVLLVALIAGCAAALANYVYDAPVRRWLTKALSSPAKLLKRT
ncbi:MAG TPA: acyltransferase [Hyphomonadaceae bacterium]|nr:acyltransferase [Hyphomonadaceae bacterium]